MYLDVTDGRAANGTNIQQWSSDKAYDWNSWKLQYAGNGYYYIRSCVDENFTYYLDVDCGRPNNGTNIQIYQSTKSDAQKFKFVPNGDGTYQITTAVSGDGSCLGVAYDSKECGTTVIEWERNGKASQSWYIEPVEEELIVEDKEKNDPKPEPKYPIYDESLSTSLTISSDWGSGAVFDISVTNNTSVSYTNGWTLQFDSTRPITQVWGGTLTAIDQDTYQVTNPAWNTCWASGEAITISGMMGSGSDAVISNVVIVAGN